MLYIEDLVLSKAQAIQSLDIAENVLSTANRYGSLGTEIPRCVAHPKQYHHLEVSTRCAAGVGFFVIGPSGHVRVCNHSQVRIGDWQHLHSIKAHPYWKRFVFKDYLPRSCNRCDEKSLCAAGCREAAHITCDDIRGPDPLLLQTTA